MTESERFIHLVADAVPSFSTAEALHIALMVTAWIQASRLQKIPHQDCIPDITIKPDELLSRFNAFRGRCLPGDRTEVDGQQLVGILNAAKNLERPSRLSEWAADIVFHPASRDSAPALAPYVADILVNIASMAKPKAIYLPFETSGQLATRVMQRGIDVWIEALDPPPVRLGLATAGLCDVPIRMGDPVLSPTLVDGYRLQTLDAAVAVLELDTKYEREPLKADRYDRFRLPCAQGALAPVLHLLAQTQGMVVVVVPDRILFSPGPERELREHLLKNGWLRAVLSLPDGAVHGFKGSASVVMIDPTRTSKDVLFVTVTSKLLGAEQGGIPKPHHVMSIVREHRAGPFSALVNADVLLAGNDLNLEPSRHLGGSGVEASHADTLLTRLDMHFEILRPRQHHLGLSGVQVHEIQAADLPSFGTIRGASKASLHDMSGANAHGYFLRPKDVLLCIKGATGKVGVIGQAPLPGEGGWVSGQSIAVLRARKADLNGYDPIALMMYLRSPLGQLKLNRLVVGTSSPTIQSKSLKALGLPVVSSHQREIIQDALAREDAVQREIQDLVKKQAQISTFLWSD
jgi:type I restriction enzyme M protein